MDVDNKGLMKEKQMRLLVRVTDQPAVLTEAQSRELEVALAELMLSLLSTNFSKPMKGGNDGVEDYA